MDEFLVDAAKGRDTILGARTIDDMVKLLKRPRKIMLMVKAGSSVDEYIEKLLPYLEKDDLIIDGGNYCTLFRTFFSKMLLSMNNVAKSCQFSVKVGLRRKNLITNRIYFIKTRLRIYNGQIYIDA